MKMNQEQSNITPKRKEEIEAEKKLEDMQKLMSDIMLEAESIEIKDTDRNKEGELLVSPNGPVSNLGKQNELWWKIARTESFKKFFGDWQSNPTSSSKIVDPNGEPLVMYRGLRTPIEVKDFYNSDFYKNKFTGTYSGVHTSPSEKVVSEIYAGEGGKFCLFVNSRKPTPIDGLSMRGLEEMRDEIFYIPRKYFKIPRFYEGLYDAIVGENRYWRKDDRTVNPKSKKLEDVYEIIVKSPEQILILPSSFKQG